MWEKCAMEQQGSGEAADENDKGEEKECIVGIFLGQDKVLRFVWEVVLMCLYVYVNMPQ